MYSMLAYKFYLLELLLLTYLIGWNPPLGRYFSFLRLSFFSFLFFLFLMIQLRPEVLSIVFV